MKKIEYIGHLPEWPDHLFKSGRVFTQGVAQEVSDELAKQLLSFPTFTEAKEKIEQIELPAAPRKRGRPPKVA